MSVASTALRWRFVDYIPQELEQGVIYFALEFGAVMHLCLDGCGERVSTPLSPAQWALTFDGETVSLWPSVGNWDIPCGSHYIIRNSRVIWSTHWSEEATRAGARDDLKAAERHFSNENQAQDTTKRPNIFERLFGWLRDKTGE
jgi:hypothetical protein